MKSPVSPSWDYENSDLINGGLGEPIPLIKGVKQEWGRFLELIGLADKKIPEEAESTESEPSTSDQE